MSEPRDAMTCTRGERGPSGPVRQGQEREA